MDEIVEIICLYYKIEPSLLKSKSRKKEIVKARSICYFFIKKNMKLSYESIGNYFGKDHGTIINGVNKVEFEYQLYEECRDEIREIWIIMKSSLDFSKSSPKENIYREIIKSVLHTDIKLFRKLRISEELRILIYRDLEIDKETIKKLEQDV